MRARMVLGAGLFLAAGAGLACGGGGGGGGGGGPSLTIAKAATSGDGQTATVATQLTDSLRVLVQQDGLAKAGVTVAWSTLSGGSLSPASVQTDASGLAAARWTLGQAAGGQTARATVSGATGSPINFAATATADAPALFTKSSGDAQTGAINEVFPAALGVKVADQFGNGIAGVTVDWSVLSGPVTLVGGTTSVTGASGIASKAISGAATTGAAQVRATTTAVGGVNLDFSATVTLPTVQVTAGDFFFHSAKNGTEDPAVDTAKVGQPVRWSVNAGTHTVESLGSPSFTSSGALSSGSTYTITFQNTGTYQYDCAIHGQAAMSGRVEVIP